MEQVFRCSRKFRRLVAVGRACDRDHSELRSTFGRCMMMDDSQWNSSTLRLYLCLSAIDLFRKMHLCMHQHHHLYLDRHEEILGIDVVGDARVLHRYLRSIRSRQLPPVLRVRRHPLLLFRAAVPVTVVEGIGTRGIC